ncbi:diguanylate cyclase domain-containing protein [Ferdinandcohnia sp. Marseille-Q9671]
MSNSTIISKLQQKNIPEIISFFVNAFNSLHDLIYIIEAKQSEFIYLYANERGVNALSQGTSIFGKTFEDLLPEERISNLTSYYEKAISLKRVIKFEEEYTLPNGQLSVTETILNPFFDENEKYIVAIVRDITENRIKIAELEKANQLLELNQQRLNSLINQNEDAVCMLDLQGNCLEVNKAIEELTGYPVKELLGKKYMSLLSKEVANILELKFSESRRSETANIETYFIHKDGHRIDISVKYIPIIVRNELIGFYSILKNITALKKSIEELQKSEQRFRIIAEHSKDIIKILDNEGTITYVSPAIEEVLGLQAKDIIGKPYYYNIHSDDVEALKENIKNIYETKQYFETEIRRIHSEGHAVWLHSDYIPVINSGDKIEKIIVISGDITDRKKKAKELSKLAFRDPLTGLPNRRLFTERFEQAIYTSNRTGRYTALLVLDFDKFKQINDSYGHDIGDEVIKELARRLKSSLRKGDTLSRVGGDEFTIVLPDIRSEKEIVDISNRLLETVNQPMQIKGLTLQTTISIGISIYPNKVEDIDLLLKEADKNLYKSKDVGGNTFTY